jgi:hypothetical protein
MAFNACYADDETNLDRFTEKEQFREFVKKLVLFYRGENAAR